VLFGSTSPIPLQTKIGKPLPAAQREERLRKKERRQHEVMRGYEDGAVEG
jgi:hypothetical protein